MAGSCKGHRRSGVPMCDEATGDGDSASDMRAGACVRVTAALCETPLRNGMVSLLGLSGVTGSDGGAQTIEWRGGANGPVNERDGVLSMRGSCAGMSGCAVRARTTNLQAASNPYSKSSG